MQTVRVVGAVDSAWPKSQIGLAKSFSSRAKWRSLQDLDKNLSRVLVQTRLNLSLDT